MDNFKRKFSYEDSKPFSQTLELYDFTGSIVILKSGHCLLFLIKNNAEYQDSPNSKVTGDDLGNQVPVPGWCMISVIFLFAPRTNWQCGLPCLLFIDY
jgi:hypothetical protein